MELTKLRLQFDEIIGYNNREFNDILWAWVKRNSTKISNQVQAGVSGQQLAEEEQKLQKFFNEIAKSIFKGNAYDLTNWICEIKTAHYKHKIRLDATSEKLSQKHL